jgi:hypothetical protein
MTAGGGAQVGLSAAPIARDLAQRGKQANVVNFALPGAGRGAPAGAIIFPP